MGTWRRGQLPQHINVRTAWPLITPLEPDSGDFGIIKQASYEYFCQRTSSAHSRDAFAVLEEEFLQMYQDCIDGQSYNEENWRLWSNINALSFAPHHEIAKPLQAESYIPIQYLSDLSEDYIPAIGLFSDSFILGPLADTLIPSVLRQLAGAICSTLPLLPYKHSAASKAFEQRPKLPLHIHQSLSAHCRYPFMLWKIQENQATPLLPISPQYIPTKPVTLLPNTSFMIGKIIQVNEQWVAHFVFPIRQLNHLDENLRIRLQVEWLRAQRHCSNLVFDDILRERADILYRYAVEHIFDNYPMEIAPCLDYYSSLVATT